MNGDGTSFPSYVSEMSRNFFRIFRIFVEAVIGVLLTCPF